MFGENGMAGRFARSFTFSSAEIRAGKFYVIFLMVVTARENRYCVTADLWETLQGSLRCHVISIGIFNPVTDLSFILRTSRVASYVFKRELTVYTKNIQALLSWTVQICSWTWLLYFIRWRSLRQTETLWLIQWQRTGKPCYTLKKELTLSKFSYH